MKKLLLSLVVCLGVTEIYCQALTPQVIASSGSSFIIASAKLDFTIGEVVTSTLTIGTTLTQGFHQPEIHYASLEQYNSDYAFTLYPNPTEQYVTVTSTKEANMQVYLFDANGKTILVSKEFTQTIMVDMQTLAAGTYLMRIASKSGEPLHSYSIIKKNNQ